MKNTTNRNIAIILAWWVWSRFWNKKPKQLLKLAGKTILEHTIDKFILWIDKWYIHNIIISTKKEYIDEVEQMILKKYSDYKKYINVISWWNTRQESSYNALLFLKEKWFSNEDNILIHDAVRPFITEKIIKDSINALNKYDSIDVAIPATDTIIKVDENNFIENIPNRNFLRRWQTPQWFKLWLIYKAHNLALKNKDYSFTDDCWIILKYFPEKNIFVVDWDEKNIKITYPIDIYIANFLLQNWIKLNDVNKIDLSSFKDKINIIFWHTSWIWKEIFDLFKSNDIKVYGFSKSTWYDISQIENVKKALDYVYSKEWKIDNVIITAWILIKKNLVEQSEEEIINQVNINYLWSVLVTKESIKYLQKTKGHIVLFGSSSYSLGREEYSIYSSIKSALVNFMQAVNEEIDQLWIKINIVNPERTLTRMRIENFWEESKDTLLDPKNVALVTLKLLTTNLTWQIINIKVDDFKK